MQLYGEAGMEGDKGRDYKKEFFFDYSYWSADPKDGHFIKQEQVKKPLFGLALFLIATFQPTTDGPLPIRWCCYCIIQNKDGVGWNVHLPLSFS